MCKVHAYTEGDKYWIDDRGKVISLSGDDWHSRYIVNNIDKLVKKYPDMKGVQNEINDAYDSNEGTGQIMEGTYLGDMLVAHGWIAVGLYSGDSYARMLDNSFIKKMFDALFDEIKAVGGRVDISFMSGGNKMAYLEEVEANIDAANQDMSLSALQELLDNGFDEVEWVGNEYECAQCQNLNGTKYSLADFISNLQHTAPIFEKSHVNCRCYLIVRNTTTGEEQKVNWEGLVM